MAGIYKSDKNRARGVRGKWSYWYINEFGRRKFATGYGDKAETLRLAIKTEEDCKRVRDGLVDPADATRRASLAEPVASYLEDWQGYILAGGATPKHANQRVEAVRKILLPTPDDKTTPLGAVEWGKVPGRAVAGDDSIRTRNYRLGAVRSFVRWLVASGKLASNPLGPVRPVKGNGTVKVRRRAMSTGEEAKLFAFLVSDKAGDVLGASAVERADLYRFALATGLRADEIRCLTCGDLDVKESTVRVRAETAKGSRAALQPLPYGFKASGAFWKAVQRPYRHARPLLRVPEKTASMLQRDLKAAGVKVETADGTIDFHALRHTYVTRLVAAGVDVKTVQTLARHADVTTTLKYYAHPDPGKLREAVEKIAKG